VRLWLAFAVALLLLGACSPVNTTCPDCMPAVVALVYSDGSPEPVGWCAGKVTGVYAGDRAATEDALLPFLGGVGLELHRGPTLAMATVRVHGGGSEQCLEQGGYRGLAPIGLIGATADIWSDGTDPVQDAQVIAHELGHLIGGLEHTGPGSLMAPDITQDGSPQRYEDEDRVNELGQSQNAYRAMVAAVAPRATTP
jgi:hypothetical protein